jgi:hypothetical protein
MVEAELPEGMSVFDRDLLVQIVTLAVASSQVTGQPMLHDIDWTAGLTGAARTLGVLIGEDVHVADTSSWQDWFADALVLAAARAAVSEILGEDRAAAWADWSRRTYTLSVAQLVLNALAARCAGVDTDELMVDLSPDHDDRFWLSERSPGGTGQVEAFQRALAQDPEAFSRALEDALRATSVDTADEELTALVRAGSPEIRLALSTLRDAWRFGHASVTAAVRSVEEAARDHDVALGGPARSALSTRIAGPGAHADLISQVVSWLDLRDRATELTGLVVDPRTLGALVAEDASVDEVLHLGDKTTVQRRARAVANVLWPWGQATQAPSAAYRRSPEISFAMIRTHVHLDPDVVDVTVWTDESRVAVHAVLVDQSEAVLRVGHTHRGVLRSVLLDLQTRPIEVGTLLCHPIVVGLRKTVHFVEVRVLLREAL